MRRVFGLALGLAISGCTLLPLPESGGSPIGQPVVGGLDHDFDAVVRRVEPVAEGTCRDRAPSSNCDFRIVVDERPGQPPNAHQTLDDLGRPVLTFTSALLADARNDDELAFVLGHEAAHHIAGHLARKQDTALAGAILGGLLANLAGGGQQAVDTAQNLGGSVGARVYSKDFELEADRLGTQIAFKAGYDPLIGAEFFTRIPDPGDRFLGTHPPNSKRIETVQQAMARLQ